MGMVTDLSLFVHIKNFLIGMVKSMFSVYPE